MPELQARPGFAWAAHYQSQSGGAGPAANLLLATCAALLFHVLAVFPATTATWLAHNLANAILINLVLAIFNMLPIPPLDGGRVAVGLLPRSLAQPLARLERYGFLIIIGVIFVLPALGRSAGLDLNLFDWLVRQPIEAILPAFLWLAGLPSGA